jgi:hypothetical protein
VERSGDEKIESKKLTASSFVVVFYAACAVIRENARKGVCNICRQTQLKAETQKVKENEKEQSVCSGNVVVNAGAGIWNGFINSSIL